MNASPPSQLLTLPPEIRLIIYCFIFESLLDRFRQSKDIKDLEPTNPFQICSEMRNEAAPEYQKWLHTRSSQIMKIDGRPADPRGEANRTVEEQVAALWKSLDGLLASARNTKCALVLKLRCRERAGEDAKSEVERIRGTNSVLEQYKKLSAKNEEILRALKG